MHRQLVTIVLVASTALLAGDPATASKKSQKQPSLTMKQVMSAAEMKAAGLHKLSARDRKALNAWLTRYSLAIFEYAQKSAPGRAVGPPPAGRSAAGSTYEIEASVNDEKFVINGELFVAQTYCFGFDKGDRVRFVAGSALGACASAKLLHTSSGQICEVWCE